jgi:hypothetical protein
MKSFFNYFNFSKKSSSKKKGSWWKTTWKKGRQDTLETRYESNGTKKRYVCYLNGKKMNCKKAKKIYTKRYLQAHQPYALNL